MSSEDYRGRPGTDPGTDPDPGTDRGQAAASGAGSGRQRLYGQDLPLCQGIATALRHVTDLPAAETREEAVQMFEEMAPPTRYVAASSGMGDPEQADRLNRADGAGRRPGEGRGGGGAGGEETYVSCYGTTDVQVLTVQEIETEPVEDVAGEEPLQGWHPLDALGSVPEGGLFGLLGGMGRRRGGDAVLVNLEIHHHPDGEREASNDDHHHHRRERQGDEAHGDHCQEPRRVHGDDSRGR